MIRQLFGGNGNSLTKGRPEKELVERI
jgi:hypothetical protein